MKYCRYCSWCAYGDIYYCGCHAKNLKRIDKPTNCKEFVESELGDVETGRKYTPRPRVKEENNQIVLQFEEGADHERRAD